MAFIVIRHKVSPFDPPLHLLAWHLTHHNRGMHCITCHSCYHPCLALAMHLVKNHSHISSLLNHQEAPFGPVVIGRSYAPYYSLQFLKLFQISKLNFLFCMCNLGNIYTCTGQYHTTLILSVPACLLCGGVPH